LENRVIVPCKQSSKKKKQNPTEFSPSLEKYERRERGKSSSKDKWNGEVKFQWRDGGLRKLI
jgi:hypothetical protein